MKSIIQSRDIQTLRIIHRIIHGITMRNQIAQMLLRTMPSGHVPATPAFFQRRQVIHIPTSGRKQRLPGGLHHQRPNQMPRHTISA